MSSIPISQEGYRLMKKELENLKKQRPEVSEAIRLAREEGDLKENGGYHAARERQGMMEARINFIESRMAKYNVIDMKALGGEKISFGATVELEDVETGDKKRYTLLGPDGQVVAPDRAHFAATQSAVIERLTRLGLV